MAEDALVVTDRLSIPYREIEISGIRAQGAGGQNVNKVSSAVHLRFDVKASSLPEFYKERVLALRDSRLTKDGVIIIKGQRHRTQDKNRDDALERLSVLIAQAIVVQATRRATKPTRNSQRKRLDSKTKRGHIKGLRGRVED